MSALANAGVALVLGVLVISAYTIDPAARRAPPAEVVTTAAPPMARAVSAARGALSRGARPDDVPSVAPSSAIPTASGADLLAVPVVMTTPSSAPAAPSEPRPAPEPAPTRRPAAAPTPRQSTPRPTPVISRGTAAAEQRMLELMNASRIAGGLRPLALDPGLTAAARAHSLVEAQVGYVYHDGPDGTARSRYVPVCGNGWYGENTGKVWSWNVDRLHIEFMNEPWRPINHRTNIMDPSFIRVGIGAVDGRDALYMTMAFCR